MHECVLAAHFPGMPAGRVGVECDVCPRQLTAVECRPPLALVRWRRVGAVPGRPGSATPVLAQAVLAQAARNDAARSASALAVGSDVSTASCRGGSLPLSTAWMWRIRAVKEGSWAPEEKVRSSDDPTTSW